MNKCPMQSTPQARQWLRAKTRHAEPIPERAKWRLHNIRAIRADKHRVETLWGPGPLLGGYSL